MAWETTSLLLGEYGRPDVDTNPLFSIVDGLVLVTQREQSGEQQRFLQISKMRGTEHNRDEHPFVITTHGIEVFAPRVTIQRQDRGSGGARCKTGISKLDDLLGEGIPRGSSLLVAGVAGTGKTISCSSSCTAARRRARRGSSSRSRRPQSAPGDRARARLGSRPGDRPRHGRDRLHSPAQHPGGGAPPDDARASREARGSPGRRRFGLGVSAQGQGPADHREKVFQLASIVQNTQAVGFFATDIPYNSNQLSRFGVEETVVDGILLLTSTEEGLERHRYVEVYKLRNTATSKVGTT